MEWKRPRVFLVGETRAIREELYGALVALGAGNWKSDAKSEAEELIEVGGRLCYKSFSTDLNANLTKIREGNHDYIGNILNQKHGSVLEHSYVSVICLDVSRIFTHELVRHRAGVGYSQESMRFVRIDNIGMYEPRVFDPGFLENSVAPYAERTTLPKVWAHTVSDQLKEHFTQKVIEIEYLVKKWADDLGLNNPKMPFSVKKKITSALRRIVPDGMTTAIMVTANHRAWRHIVEMRTNDGAEEEIIQATYDIGGKLKLRYPAIYQDMNAVQHKDGSWGWTFTNSKI